MSEERSGWNAITEAFEKLYPGQTDPKHYGTLIKYRFGGNDPLDGVSIYDGGDFWHFVTYGISELDEKESEDLEWSGFGFEFTLKLKKGDNIDEDELKGLVGNLQNIARYIYNSGAVFHPNQYIYTGQENGMDARQESKLTGFATTQDPAGKIDTPNGKVEFIQLVGLTDKELKAIHNKEYKVIEILDKLGNTLTDYTREDII